MNSIIKFFGDIVTSIWCHWSNIRFKQAERFSTFIQEADLINYFVDIRAIAKMAYENFEWTADGIDQLGDAIVPPPCAYNQIIKGKFKDDCDGFHAAMLHILLINHIESYLLTANAIGGGHCILIFKYNDKWYILDYTRIYGPGTTAKEVIDIYNKEYPVRYKTKEVIYNGIVKYDYTTGKYTRIPINKLK